MPEAVEEHAKEQLDLQRRRKALHIFRISRRVLEKLIEKLHRLVRI